MGRRGDAGTQGRADRGMRRRGDTGKRRRGDTGTRRCGDTGTGHCEFFGLNCFRAHISKNFAPPCFLVALSPRPRISPSPVPASPAPPLHFDIRNVLGSQILHEVGHFIVAITRVVCFYHEEEVIACGERKVGSIKNRMIRLRQFV